MKKSAGLREEGFLVEVAVEGLSGWHSLRTASWDVLVLDWWLPGQDGLTVLQCFRQINQITPVLFLTARDAVEQRIQGLNAGADHYLCKPFAFRELVARIHALLRRRPGSIGTQLRCQDVGMDLTTLASSGRDDRSI
jgi:two-component system copper resistance phosphate regulon response regulator CusR